MEEAEYKTTYSTIASIRCEFEKALTNNKARCSCSRHFWLADREGYACKTEVLSGKCRKLLQNLRENSRFVLKLQQPGDALPHNMEIRVQAGGLSGINSLIGNGYADTVDDVHDLIDQAETAFGGLDKLPYDRIVQSVSRYQGRKSRKRSRESPK